VICTDLHAAFHQFTATWSLHKTKPSLQRTLKRTCRLQSWTRSYIRWAAEDNKMKRYQLALLKHL